MFQIKKITAGLLCFALCLTVLPLNVRAEDCDHTYVEMEEAATCTRGGVRYYECSKCGYQYGHENTDPLGHDYGAWQVTQEASCEKEGEMSRECSRCGNVETQAIEAEGHSYTTSMVEPDCESQGYTRYTCSKCGDSYKTDYTDALGHQYTTKVVEPTCEKEGYTQKTCSRCGDTVKSDYVDALGHSYEREIIAPTCEKQGYTLLTCTVCGETEKTDYVDALGHSYESEIIAPTCKKQGYTLLTCTVCGETEKTDYVDALGHSYESEVIAPTCKKQGYTLLTCTVCGETEKTDYVDALGHSYETEVVAPTCTKNGYTLQTCALCGDTEKTDVTEKTGHHYDDGVVTKEATTTAMGRITYTCLGCGDSYTETTPKLVNPFVDVKQSAYYFNAVIWAVDRGITSGTDETHFSPESPCTRAQVVTFLWRAAGSPEPEGVDCPFTDVPAGSYYRKAVVWAAEQGITSGIDATHFGPEQSCTRAQVVTFLYRAKGSPEWETVNRFSDVKRGDYYYVSVCWAADNGITSGVDGERFAPDQVCIRAQIVTFLHRADSIGE